MKHNVHRHAVATPPEDSTTRLIPLTKGESAIVDTEDYAHLSKFNWHLVGRGPKRYAARWLGNGKVSRMHREILNAPPDMQVDHINRNGLDNRRSNLRLATTQQNTWNQKLRRDNTSGYKGVVWDKQSRKWRAQIRTGNRQIGLGLFDRKEDAFKRYLDVALAIRGEYFPKDLLPKERNQ